MADEREIASALDLLTGPSRAGLAWMHGPGICGLGLAERVTAGRQLQDLALKVYVERKLPLAQCDLPIPKELRIEGLPPIPIDVEEVGRIELHAGSSAVRPAKPGTSVSLAGNQTWTGTFGMVAVKRGQQQPWYLVSSSHVIANSGLATVGDAIVQPAASAGGQAPADTIASLSEWVPFQFSDTEFNNLVDAAIAELDPGAASAAIVELGLPAGVSTELARGMVVQKVGGQTGHSIAQIKDIHLRLPSYYPTAGGQVERAGFTDQVLTSFYAGQGDSGAPVLNMSNEIVGFQFAGSVSVSIFSKIQNLLSALDLELITAASDGSAASEAEARDALDQHQSLLESLPNVVGMGIVSAEGQPGAGAGTKGGSAIAVYVKRKVAADQLEATQRVPSQLPSVRGGKQKNVPTKVIEVGDITPG
jgi:hypothetical protein